MIKVADVKDFKGNEDIIAYRYLFWACSRGSLFTVHFILRKYGISPFMSVDES